MNIQSEQDKPQIPLRRHWTRLTHRVFGVTSVLFLVLISASGLILNHADALGLPGGAAAPWVLRLYSSELPAVDSAFSAADVLFATSADTLYANGKELAKGTDRLIGSVVTDDVKVVATASEFFLVSHDTILIERFAPDASGSMRELGTDGQHIFVAIHDAYYQFDLQRMSLSSPSSFALENIAWSQPARPSVSQAEQIGTAALGQAINWERVLLDFRSGRILPTVGRYLADITALCLLYMCFTGLWILARGR
ncbi:MAG: hypothetical protein HQ492_06995 [Woeseiaceae bacterium]|nr:hypothetical protein [Woeseiaceae bacterium]